MNKDMSDNDITRLERQSKNDMEVAKRNSHFIKDIAEECYILRTIIEAFREAAGPYAEPYIDAQLEGILGVYRKKIADE